MLVAMHMPDHTLSPAVVAVTGLLAAAVALWSAWQVRRNPLDATKHSAGLIASVAALIFAGQMVNYPLPMFVGAGGVSGHLLGGAIAALLLGPWAGMGVMIVVLTVQCLIFGDGGFAALGANVLNMAIVGVWTAWGVRQLLTKPGKSVGLLTAALAGFASVVAAATVCSLELLATGGADAASFAGPMFTYHLVIGFVEAQITLGVVAMVTAFQATSATQSPADLAKAGTKGALVAFVAAIVVAICLAPIASASPDGLEVALVQGNFATGDSMWNAPLPDYEFPSTFGFTGAAAVAAIGILGTLLAFAGSWSAARAAKAVARRS
jgi:cobalt/nickel transport system permease protein